ncbi:unnamed protein product, partial [Ceratitis capitata]
MSAPLQNSATHCRRPVLGCISVQPLFALNMRQRMAEANRYRSDRRIMCVCAFLRPHSQ